MTDFDNDQLFGKNHTVYEESKMNENVQKFYGIDKYKKEVGNLKEESSKNISDTIIIAKLKLNEEKLERIIHEHLLNGRPVEDYLFFEKAL